MTRLMNTVCLLTVLYSFPVCTVLLDPLSGVSVVGSAVIAGFLAGYQNLRCIFQECCSDRWIKINGTELLMALDAKVYGQHLVKKAVVKHIKSHIKSKNPSKALALSFHGGTGTGKNYVSRIIAEHVFKKGMKSKYVHVLPATKEFPHEEMLALYKDKLRELIEKSTAECERSLFIFDEMDKMPPGLIDMVKPYVDFYEQLDGVNYRKAIFIFLSNAAGQEISRHSLQHWQDGKKREDIQLSDMEKIITTAAVNTKDSGLWHSDLLIRHMITAYIPFLPMERRHIKQCIRDTLLEKKHYKRASDIKEEKVQEILNQLSYYPKDEQIYSVTGCKRVPEKVDYIMEDMD